MRKNDKRNFCRFLRLISVIVTLVLKRQLFCINICCFLSLFFSGLVKCRDWYYSITQPRKPLYERISEISYTCWVIAYFVSNFVAMTTGVSCCRIVCHHSIATSQTRKSAMCKDFGYISYTSKVTVDFVSNFVAMATGVGCGVICLTSFNSSTPKPPWYTEKSRRYLLYKLRYSRYCVKFRCHGNRGWSWWNFSDIIW